MTPFWISREEALADGFTHEGTHFGLPVWCQYGETADEMGFVAAKVPIFEFVLTMGVMLTQFCNWFRPSGDEFMFAFCIRRIETCPSA